MKSTVETEGENKNSKKEEEDDEANNLRKVVKTATALYIRYNSSLKNGIYPIYVTFHDILCDIKDIIKPETQKMI